MNNNYYSPNNNENQQEQEAFSPSQKKKIKFLIVMLDIFSIITMWLFAYQLGGFSDSEFTFKNPVIIIANMVCIVLSVVIITKSIHWFDSQPLMAVLIITLLMLSMALMIVMAFFVPISFIYIIPAVIILGLLLLLLICINTSNYKKILLVIMVIAVLFCAFRNATKVSYIQNIVQAEQQVMVDDVIHLGNY